MTSSPPPKALPRHARCARSKQGAACASRTRHLLGTVHPSLPYHYHKIQQPTPTIPPPTPTCLLPLRTAPSQPAQQRPRRMDRTGTKILHPPQQLVFTTRCLLHLGVTVNTPWHIIECVPRLAQSLHKALPTVAWVLSSLTAPICGQR